MSLIFSFFCLSDLSFSLNLINSCRLSTTLSFKKYRRPFTRLLQTFTRNTPPSLCPTISNALMASATASMIISNLLHVKVRFYLFLLQFISKLSFLAAISTASIRPAKGKKTSVATVVITPSTVSDFFLFLSKSFIYPIARANANVLSMTTSILMMEPNRCPTNLPSTWRTQPSLRNIPLRYVFFFFYSFITVIDLNFAGNRCYAGSPNGYRSW